MNYELLEQLKNAGFPKEGFEYDEGIPSVQITPTVSVPGDKPRWRNVPTLSELIEACGEKFHALNQHGTWSAHGDKLWSAEPKGQNYKDMKKGTGKTPEIAVANLWLAIHSQPVDQQTD
jgi:hypothetical protein